MPEALENKELTPNLLKSSTGGNALEDLMINLIENTEKVSPYVPDTYKQPWNPDDLFQKHFDYSIYEQMLNDDQVSVCTQLKKDLILGDGFIIQTQEEGQEELQEFLKDTLENQYDGDFLEDLEEIITAYDFGFSLTEKIFKVGNEQRLCLKNLLTRHPNSWLIYQDQKGAITKFVQRVKSGEKEIARTSLIHLINNKRFQNPYGTSDLRAAYNAYIAKLHVVRMLSIFLEKAASPIPVGRFDKNAPKNFASELLNILKRFQATTAITIPKDVEVQFLEAKSNGEAYRAGIQLFNMFIGRALFIPDLLGFTGGETGGGSFALGKEQINLFFLHIQRRKNALQNLVQKEIINPILQWNFGIIENPPLFKFKPIDDSKALDLAKVWLEAVKGNAYKANDEEINHFRNLVKFPEGIVIKPEIPAALAPEDQKEEDSQEDDQESKEEPEDQEAEKKDFAKKYDQTPGDYHKKVNFKAMKTKLDDYDNSLMNDVRPVVNKMLMDLMDQIQKKKIVQDQKVDRIDSLSLKYKKELNQVIKKSMYMLYKDAQKQAESEVQKSEFAKSKPLDEDKFLEVLDQEIFSYIGDYEYTILKATRAELMAAVKDGRPFSTVLSILDDDLKKLSTTSLERYSRTKHTEVMNSGRLEYFDSTGVITGYQYSAIMDDRTSDICSGLHGKFFKAGDQPTPPMHFNCRSTLIPITKFEQFKPTETIRGQTTDKFIEDNLGRGFGKYTKSKEEAKEIQITDPGVDFETIFEDNKEITRYSFKGKVFQETISTFSDSTRTKQISVKHNKIAHE